MNLEHINQVIKDYKSLISLIESKLKVMEQADSKYDTRNYIESISFEEEDSVYVICDATVRGYYETSSFTFPVFYLSLSDSDLSSLVISEKNKNLEEANAKHIKITKDTAEKLLQKELEQLAKLKTKYPNN